LAKTSLVFGGIDPSLSATGMVLLKAVCVRGRVEVEVLDTRIERTSYEWPMVSRVNQLCGSVRTFSRVGNNLDRFAVEDFARGAKFRREEQGMAVGALLVGLGPRPVVMVSPLDAKMVACPKWPGLSKANWAAAGYTKKFKRSMPGKADVISGLQRRWSLTFHDDALADAACVAIYAACRALKVNPHT
jgi:hypothetical protein